MSVFSFFVFCALTLMAFIGIGPQEWVIFGIVLSLGGMFLGWLWSNPGYKRRFEGEEWDYGKLDDDEAESPEEPDDTPEKPKTPPSHITMK